MSKSFHAVMTQKDLRPAYYDDFHCLMGDCRLNCCRGGWHITFGKKDYMTIRKQKGTKALNTGLAHCLRRIRQNVDEQYRYGEFVLQNGDCPLLREGKCGLQLEKGEKVLPFVCRTFPRVEAPMPSGYLERTLTPACEGVLALLWDLEEGVEFRSDPLEKEEWKTFSYVEDGEALWAYFQDIRELCIDILQDRRRPLPERIVLLGMVLEPLSAGETDVPGWLARARAMANGDTAGVVKEELLPMFLVHNVNTVLLSQDADQFSRVQQEICTALGLPGYVVGRGSVQPGPYLAARTRSEQEFKGREHFFENLMVTVFFHMRMPDLRSREALWRSYVNFCSLFDELVLISRRLIHNRQRQEAFRDDLFRHESSTLAHMAVLVSG